MKLQSDPDSTPDPLMETEDMYEVERIVDRRLSALGQVEYLVRWRGYGADGDTWEPETNLETCSAHIHQFNQSLLRERHRVLQRSTHRPSASTPSPHLNSDSSPGPDLGLDPGLDRGRDPGLDPGLDPQIHRLDRSGIKILVPRSPLIRVQEQEQARPLPDSIPASGPNLETQCVGGGGERARMGTRPRPALRTLPGNGAVPEVASGGAVTKRRLDERFDKRLRFSVRQTENAAYRFREVIVKKHGEYTQIQLSTRSTRDNALSPEVMREIQSAMAGAACDDSRLVLLSSVGPVFCSGLDFVSFIPKLTEDRKESLRMAETVRTFVNSLVQFPKPLVAAVSGAALGLGCSLLSLCDVVWASDKAWFQTPYAQYGQTPDGCSSYSFPLIMGPAAAGEMLLGSRRLTALEACSRGLVSQVLWPHTFNQEVHARIRELVCVDSQVLRESKSLVRSWSRSGLEQTNDRETETLARIWASAEFTHTILQYLQRPPEY